MRTRFCAWTAIVAMAMPLLSGCPLPNHQDDPTVPEFSPPGGSYMESVDVTIPGIDPVAENLRYSLSGMDPSGNMPAGSPAYSGPIHLDRSGPLCAETRIGESSAMNLAYYSIGLLAPEASIPPGDIAFPATLRLTLAAGADPANSIRYTLDGSTPLWGSALYAEPGIELTGPATVTARAFRDGTEPSEVLVLTYTSAGAVAAPTVDRPAGYHTAAVDLVLDSATAGAVIRWTTDGSDPVSGSTWTEAPAPAAVRIEASARLRAYARKDGLSPSASIDLDYTITGPVAEPGFSVPAGTWAGEQSVAITCATPGSSIRYTLDGSTPSRTAGTLYSGPVTVASSSTLRAHA